MPRILIAALLMMAATAVVTSASPDDDEPAMWDDRPTMIGNFANVPQVWYGFVKLHQLEQRATAEFGIHTVTMLPKRARDKSPLVALEPYSGRSKAQDALFKYEFEATVSGDPDTRGFDDAVAEADAADAWATLLSPPDGHESRKLHPPRVMFNASGGHVWGAVVVADNDHLQPFTLLVAHSDTGDVVLNVTSVDHALGAAAVKFPMNFRQCGMCVDLNMDYEILLHFHARRMTTFEVQFQPHDVPDDGSPKILVPWNATLGAKFVVRLQDGSLGVWATRRTPIPDFALEVYALDTHKSNDPKDAIRVVASVFSNVEPGGMGLSDVLLDKHSLWQTDGVIFTAVVHFAERPRRHYARFIIEDMFGLVSRARRRPVGDGEILTPTVVDHITTSAKTNLLPLRLFVRLLPGNPDYLTVELLQPRPIEHVQLWVRNINHTTIFLEEERHIDHVEHWRRDVPLFGWHHVIPITRPHPGNTLQIDVLYDNATSVDSTAQLMEWAHDHGADVSRIRIQRAAVGSSVDFAAAVTGGHVLVTAADAVAGHRLALLPSTLMLFSAQSYTVPWIRALLEGSAFSELRNLEDTDEPMVALFFGLDSPTHQDYVEVLELTLMVLASVDPPNVPEVRYQRLYATLREVAATSLWKAPLTMVNESVALLNQTAPHFTQRYVVDDVRAWTAVHEFLVRHAGWLMKDAVRHGWSDGRGGTRGGTSGWPLEDFLRVVSVVRQVMIPGDAAAHHDAWHHHAHLVPIVNFAPFSEAPNAVLQRLDSPSSSLQLTALRDLKNGEVITIAPFISLLTTFEALALHGFVPADSVAAVDFPDGMILRADDKLSRDPLMLSLCGDGYATEPARMLQCLLRLRTKLVARNAELPLVVERPKVGSSLYDRNVRLVLGATRCLVGSRKALRVHLTWVDDDIAMWELVVPSAQRLGEL